MQQAHRRWTVNSLTALKAHLSDEIIGLRHPRPSAARWPISRIRHDIAVFAASSLFAAAMTQVGRPNHRTWAWWAFAAYGIATLALLAGHRVGRCTEAYGGVILAVFVTTLALVCPLTQMAITGQGQEELTVVAQAAQRLLGSGSLYPVGDELARSVAQWDSAAYFPYLPVMAMLGVPSEVTARLWGLPVLSDPRLTFAALYLAAIAFVLRRNASRPGQWVILVASPLAALPLSCGGHDMPVVGALLVGLSLSKSDRPVASGVVIGLGCAAKPFAWPLMFTLAVVWFRRRERGAGLAFTGTACAVVATPLALVLIGSEKGLQGLLVHNYRFPAGLEPVESPAASPFPGHLLASYAPGGHLVALGLLGIAAVSLSVHLLLRPPRTEAGAAYFCAIGLTVATLLAPATRGGYLIYPLALFAFGYAIRDNDRESRAEADLVDAARHRQGRQAPRSQPPRPLPHRSRYKLALRGGIDSVLPRSRAS